MAADRGVRARSAEVSPLNRAWSTDVIIRFDDTDRVKAVQIDKPRSICM
jgi:hypothetical protein